MHNKLRVTLTSLSVALGFVAGTLMLAQPIMPLAARDGATTVLENAAAQHDAAAGAANHDRSEEHTSELQSLMRISYAVFCLKKKNNNKTIRQLVKHRHHK